MVEDSTRREGDKKRKRYDKEFKIDAVRLIVEKGRSVASVVRDLGVNENSLHHWRKQLLEDGQGAFPGHGRLKPEDEELRPLRPELEEVKEERDILKKGLGYFSKRGKRYQFVEEHRELWRIGLMCRVLLVSRSGYYAWRRRPQSERSAENEQLKEAIRREYLEGRCEYGRVVLCHAEEGACLLALIPDQRRSAKKYL